MDKHSVVLLKQYMFPIGINKFQKGKNTRIDERRQKSNSSCIMSILCIPHVNLIGQMAGWQFHTEMSHSMC